IFISSHNLFETNNSFTRSNTIDNAILTESIAQEFDELCNNSLISNEILQFDPIESTNVIPIDFMSELNALIPYDPIQVSNDLECQQKFLPYDIIKSEKIQIKCQPRSEFRPRTQNESKISTHYLRCENGAELDYPAICVSHRLVTYK
ncbi:unnamed protein product, partial [Rotaria sp. Silwood1]